MFTFNYFDYFDYSLTILTCFCVFSALSTYTHQIALIHNPFQLFFSSIYTSHSFSTTLNHFQQLLHVFTPSHAFHSRFRLLTTPTDRFEHQHMFSSPTTQFQLAFYLFYTIFVIFQHSPSLFTYPPIFSLPSLIVSTTKHLFLGTAT